MSGAMSERLRSIHHFGLETNEECAMILANCFLGVTDGMHSDLKKGRDFRLHCSEEYLEKSYEYYKQALKCLFYKSKWFQIDIIVAIIKKSTKS